MFEKVLVGVDEGARGRDAIALAKRLAAQKANATLAHIYKVGPTLGAATALALDSALEAARLLLEQQRDEAAIDADVAVLVALSVSVGLHDLAEERSADLLVLGSCRRGPLGRILAGDDARRTLHGAPCPVAIAPVGYMASPGRLSRIGVGLDGSAESGRALVLARELAACHGAGLKAMAVAWPPTPRWIGATFDESPQAAERRMRSQIRELNAWEQVEQEVAVGDPGEELVRFATGLDLLVVGSRSEGALGRLLDGSTSDYLERHVGCPLVVVPRSSKAAARPPAAERQAESDLAGEVHTPPVRPSMT